MNCHEYRTDLDEYVDGTLTAERTAAVEAHLATCPSCRALAADLRTLRSVAASLERRTPPPHVWNPVHVPQLSVPPQPSDGVPQLSPSCAQVFGVQLSRTSALESLGESALESWLPSVVASEASVV